jgi:hypothetical protein
MEIRVGNRGRGREEGKGSPRQKRTTRGPMEREGLPSIRCSRVGQPLSCRIKLHQLNEPSNFLMKAVSHGGLKRGKRRGSRATELRRQERSQMEFGNEGRHEEMQFNLARAEFPEHCLAYLSRVARTTCCPGARARHGSAQERATEFATSERPPVAFGDPDNELSGPPKCPGARCRILYFPSSGPSGVSWR